MYKVTATGQYHAKNGGEFILKDFKESFDMPKLELANNIIQNKLIVPMLQGKHPDFCGVHTCKVSDHKLISAGKESKETKDVLTKSIDKMTLEELRQYIQVKGVDINVDKLGSIQSARQAVSDAVDNLEMSLSPEKVSKRKPNIYAGEDDSLPELPDSLD